MVPTKIEFDEHIKGLLNRLHRVTPLNPQAVAEERAKFLAQGELFRATVSQPYNRRHIGWINTFVLAFQRKERKPMLNALMAVVISITVLFGGAGATVYAAQGSLPDQPLYQVKTLSEDFRLALAGSAQGQLDLNLEFADRRVAEVVKLQAADKAIPEGVTARLQEELNAALQIAAGMDDPQMIQALTQIRQQAEVQAQIMAAVMNAGSNQGNSVLARIQERLQEQVRLAAAGEADPQGFRIQVRDRDRVNRPTQTPHPTQPGSANHTPAPTGTSYGPGPGAGQPTGTPGHYGPGEPNPSQTPEPTGGSYGPGPGTGQPTGTPGHYGPGEPNPSQTPEPTGGSYGPGPGAGQPSETPGGYGPGPQAGTATCTPAHDGGGPGPGPLNPSATPQAGDPGAGNGQATVTPQQGGNSEGGQPTEDPGYGGGQP